MRFCRTPGALRQSITGLPHDAPSMGLISRISPAPSRARASMPARKSATSCPRAVSIISRISPPSPHLESASPLPPTLVPLDLPAVAVVCHWLKDNLANLARATNRGGQVSPPQEKWHNNNGWSHSEGRTRKQPPRRVSIGSTIGKKSATHADVREKILGEEWELSSSRQRSDRSRGVGPAANIDLVGRPLCPCNFYPDKKAEVERSREWVCACDEMKKWKYCHCLLFVAPDGMPITEYLPEDHEGRQIYGLVKDPLPGKGREASKEEE